MHTLEDSPDALARVLDWWRWAMRGTMEWADVSLLCRRAAGEAFDAAGAPLFPGTTPRGLLQISEELQLLADIAAQHYADSLSISPAQMQNLIPTERSL